jgi:ATP-dependent Clp protease ATP-binding subunit ClpA
VFERFTEEARQVVVLAQQEARGLYHHYIGTEHLLLGLLRAEEDRPQAQRPLQALGVTLIGVREQVVRIVRRGEEPAPGQIPFTPRAKKVLELALREALGFGHKAVAPEHILLGLARENEGVAARVLLDYDVDSEKIARQVSDRLAAMSPEPAVFGHAARRRFARVPVDEEWLEELGEALHPLADEIQNELGRTPDAGDLLLVLASARRTLAAQALAELGVDLDALWGTLERIRNQQANERGALAAKLITVRAQKARALESQQFEEAARLRDEERELLEQVRGRASLDPDAMREIRHRLGLPTG